MGRYSIILIFMALCVSCAGKPDASPSGSTSQQATTVSDAQPSSAAVFNTDSAMAYIAAQVAFGPRVPGTSAHAACADWLASTLRAMGTTVTDATVTDVHPVTGKPLKIRNIFAQSNPAAQKRILVLAHYDTRPVADQDPDPSHRNTPIDGANDGASGVGVALELMRLACTVPPTVGLDVLLVDQEDSGEEASDETWCIGSRYWATHRPADYRPMFAILLDMVGGRNACFPREAFSDYAASYVNDIVWSAAADLGLSSRFVNEVGGAINDDHLSLLQNGIPAIDIIDIGRPTGFNPTWHTLDDNMDNIDAATVRDVGNVVTKVLYDQK